MKLKGKAKGCKKVTDKVKLLSSNLAAKLSGAKVDSGSSFDFITCIESVGGVKCPQSAYPLVFLVFQTLAFRAPTPDTTSMASSSQSLLWCFNMIQQSPSQVLDIARHYVFGATLFEMFVEPSVVSVPLQTRSLCLTPPSTHIHSAANIEELASSVMSQVYKPDKFLLHWSW